MSARQFWPCWELNRTVRLKAAAAAAIAGTRRAAADHGAVHAAATCVSIACMAHGTNDTLASLPGEYALHFHCSNMPSCQFNKPMDVDLLITSLGPGFATRDLYHVLKCPACKSRSFLVILTPVQHAYGYAVKAHSAAKLHSATGPPT